MLGNPDDVKAPPKVWMNKAGRGENAERKNKIAHYKKNQKNENIKQKTYGRYVKTKN